MDCPFTPERLHELVWTETFTPRQIATLAQVALGEPVDEAQVRAWMVAANVAERVPGATRLSATLAKPVKPKPVKVARQHKKRPCEGMVTRPCDYCAVLVTRYACEMMEHVYCGEPCAKLGKQVDAAKRKLQKAHRLATADLAALKTCPKCQQSKPLAEFSVDRSRFDGRTRICKACNDAKSRAYYLANQERLKEAARQRQRKREE